MDASTLNTFVTATAVLAFVQTIVLVALFVVVWKTSARARAMADQVERRLLPVLDSAQVVLSETRPKLIAIAENLAATTTSVRGQMERLDATVNDMLDRARLQVIRADDVVSRTMDKVEETTEMVHHSVISPIRQLTGLLDALTTGIGVFLGRSARQQHPRERVKVGQDEERALLRVEIDARAHERTCHIEREAFCGGRLV